MTIIREICFDLFDVDLQWSTQMVLDVLSTFGLHEMKRRRRRELNQNNERGGR